MSADISGFSGEEWLPFARLTFQLTEDARVGRVAIYYFFLINQVDIVGMNNRYIIFARFEYITTQKKSEGIRVVKVAISCIEKESIFKSIF